MTDSLQERVLVCHPDVQNRHVRNVGVRVQRTPGGELAVGFSLNAKIAHVRVPPPRTPRFTEGLWEHTCFELFIGRPGVPAYHEFNFSPSGEWAAYAFTGYRVGVPLLAETLTPQMAVRHAAERLELDAVIRLDLLSPALVEAKLRLGLSTVVEDETGALSYWALRHVAGQPDFHHAEAFAMELDEARR